MFRDKEEKSDGALGNTGRECSSKKGRVRGENSLKSGLHKKETIKTANSTGRY